MSMYEISKGTVRCLGIRKFVVTNQALQVIATVGNAPGTLVWHVAITT
jgi:hypothetical protein